MKHFLLGTAGHVDHGKTALIGALTHVDTDRLPEEKERGLSIDLGFAPLLLPGPDPEGASLAVGIVDVPGHQRFLRNMIAGVGGFDAALLVVDPGEGVKPQTREHLAILDLLDTPRGLVVLTKADRSDEDTLELARMELSELLQGTFLEDAEMVVTSVHDPESLERLKARLYAMFSEVEPRRAQGVARLPVDRAFSKTGFGTVVTGSLWNGTLQVGSEVEVMPGGEIGKIRGLQVHGEPVDSAVAGQRVAVNLSGLERAELARGTTLVSPPGVLPKGERFAVSFRLLEPNPELLTRKVRATFFQATGHGPVSFNSVAAEGEEREIYGQLHFEEETFLCPGDRFLLRDETDQKILGGGLVLALDERPFQRRQSKMWLRRYQNLSGGGQLGQLLQALQEAGGYAQGELLRKNLGWALDDWNTLRPTITESGRVRYLANDRVWDAELFARLAGQVESLIGKLHLAAPWKPGWRKEELIKLLGQRSGRDDGMTELLEALVLDEVLQRRGPVYSRHGHLPELSAELKEKARQVVENLTADGPSPRDWEIALAQVASHDLKAKETLEEHLLGTGALERLTDKLVFSPQALKEAREVLIRESGGRPFPTSEAREWLATTRKFIIPILEWMDKKGWSYRVGDERTMRPQIA